MMQCQCQSTLKRGGCDNDADERFSPLCLECEDRGCQGPPIRYAIVRSAHSVAQVAPFLPRNYRANQTSVGVVIRGFDSHGWTLDGYVLPRLGSALIAAEEATMDLLARKLASKLEASDGSVG